MLLKRLAVSVAVFLSFGVALNGASPAQAAATAYNIGPTWLTQYTSPSLPTVCRSLDIQLAAGSYKWGAYFGGLRQDHYQVTIWLAKGKYEWRQCLDPGNNGWYSLMDGSLKMYNSSNPKASLPVVASRISSSGEYTWGSYLDPQF